MKKSKEIISVNEPVVSEELYAEPSGTSMNGEIPALTGVEANESAKTDVVSAEVPKSFDLSALATEAEELAAVASNAALDLEEKIKLHQATSGRLDVAKNLHVSRIERVKGIEPLAGLEVVNYKLWAKEGIITEADAGYLEIIDQSIDKIERGINFLSPEKRESSEEKLEKLYEARAQTNATAQALIQEKQDEFAARKEEVTERINAHYGKRIQELNEILQNLEDDPRVKERLRAMEEERRLAFEAEMKKAYEAVIRDAVSCVQSLGSRHDNAFSKIGAVLDIKPEAGQSFFGKFKAAWDSTERDRQSYFDSVHDRLISAVLNGDGPHQIKAPSEIVPWEVLSKIRYGDALEFLNKKSTRAALTAMSEKFGDKQAEATLERMTTLFSENQILRKLIGPKLIKREGQPPQLSKLFAAFATRAKWDKDGTTEIRRQAEKIKAAQQEEFERKAAEIIARGGFIVTAHKIAVRLEQKLSKKGKGSYWEVVEVEETEAARNGITVGMTSAGGFTHFPTQLEKAANKHYESINKETGGVQVL